MKIIYPIIQTALAVVMLLNWISTGTEFNFTLFSFGLVSGIAFSSWTHYLIPR